MNRLRNSICLVVIIGLIGMADMAASRGASPEATVQNLLNTIQKIKTDDKLTPKERESNHQLSSQALTMIDIHEVSRKALGRYWEGRTPKEQKEFVDLLSMLFLQEAFPNSGKFFAGLTLVYGTTKIEKENALVPLTVVHKEEGEVHIDFHLRNNGHGWQVVDVDLDEVSMRNNLRSQFYRIIARKNFPELVRRMEKKLQNKS